jgi:ADP-ribose pyrophosphatase YjhB (NUDIX family)
MIERTYPDRPIVGVGVVVWRNGRVLLIRRGKAPRAGQWSIPGGAQHLGETLAEAAAREVAEETGLALASLSFLTTVDLIERGPDGRVRYHYTLVDFVAEAADGTALPGDDAAEVGWFGMDELANLGLWSETVRVIAASRDLLAAAAAAASRP